MEKVFLVTPKMIGYKNYKELYLDWVNNFISVGWFADYHNIDIEKADEMIHTAARIYKHKFDSK